MKDILPQNLSRHSRAGGVTKAEPQKVTKKLFYKEAVKGEKGIA